MRMRRAEVAAKRASVAGWLVADRMLFSSLLSLSRGGSVCEHDVRHLCVHRVDGYNLLRFVLLDDRPKSQR